MSVSLHVSHFQRRCHRCDHRRVSRAIPEPLVRGASPPLTATPVHRTIAVRAFALPSRLRARSLPPASAWLFACSCLYQNQKIKRRPLAFMPAGRLPLPLSPVHTLSVFFCVYSACDCPSRWLTRHCCMFAFFDSGRLSTQLMMVIAPKVSKVASATCSAQILIYPSSLLLSTCALL